MISDREKILAIVDNDCLMPSDAAILLEGDGFFRFQKAVDLYNKGIITKKIFGFDFNSENIYIGEIPLNITKYLHHEHCYIVDNEWGCKLNSVYLSNENGNEYTFSSKIKRAVFSFTVEYLSISKEEFLRLTNFLFEKEI